MAAIDVLFALSRKDTGNYRCIVHCRCVLFIGKKNKCLDIVNVSNKSFICPVWKRDTNNCRTKCMLYRIEKQRPTHGSRKLSICFWSCPGQDRAKHYNTKLGVLLMGRKKVHIATGSKIPVNGLIQERDTAKHRTEPGLHPIWKKLKGYTKHGWHWEELWSLLQRPGDVVIRLRRGATTEEYKLD